MRIVPRGAWQPTRFVRFEQAFDTSVGTAIIVTDAGKAYLKALGNRQGPHALAKEWLGTHLADWFGLPTFDYALLVLDALDEVPFPRGGAAAPGPAFVTRAEQGDTWGGSSGELDRLINPEDVSRLVVFDTWIRNCDRHSPGATRRPNYDNVFLSREQVTSGRSRLVAMDHTHCFCCDRDLDSHVADIDPLRDERVYGLFPSFEARVTKIAVATACARLRELTQPLVASLVESIPREWDVSAESQAALTRFVLERAGFVADTIEKALALHCWPPQNQSLF